MVQKPISAVGFDLDDTLCVYLPVAERARRMAFAELMLPHTSYDLETIDHHYKLAFKEVLEIIHTEPWYSLYKHEGHPTRLETMRRMLEKLGLPNDGLAEQLSWRYLHLREQHLHLFEDTLPVLNALRERYPLFVITNGPAREQRRELELLGLTDYFQVVAIEGEVGVGKPHPDIFRFVESQLNLPPEQMLFVGNSWKHDVMGAYQAGWQALWLNRDQQPHPEPELPIGTLHSLYELLEWL